MNDTTDLIRLIENDLGHGISKQGGRKMLFHCPFPGHKHGDKKPSLDVINKPYPFWKCWSCGKQGNDKKWLMEYRGLTYQEALQVLNMSEADQHRERQAPPAQPPDTPPSTVWQAQAWKLIQRAQDVLWSNSGKDALEYLLMRGLTEETILAAQLGYIPQDYKNDPKVWGTPNDDPDPMYFFKGILMPGMIGADVWYLKMRQEDHPNLNKYIQVRGSKPALYGAETLSDRPAAICEGELDKLLLSQEAFDLVDVVTMGSATNKINLANWGLYLMRPSCFILAYDMDAAGDKGADELSWLHDSHRLHIPTIQPGDKDLTDYYLHGGDLHGDLHELIQNALHPYQESDLPK